MSGLSIKIFANCLVLMCILHSNTKKVSKVFVTGNVVSINIWTLINYIKGLTNILPQP